MAATTDHLEWLNLPNPNGGAPIESWSLEVLGKGNKLRRVPVPSVVMAQLDCYLARRGFASDSAAGRLPRSVALLGQSLDLADRAPWTRRETPDPVAPISDRGLADQLKRFFVDAAAAVIDDPRATERLANASTHWLRHTHISHSLAAGAPTEVVQQNAGHSSLDTTTRYGTTEEARRIAAM